MKMVIISLGIVSFSFFSCVHACQIPDFIEYRKAMMEDAAGIVDLINAYGVHDNNNKIVILPRKFRLSAVQKNIEAGRYYIARDIVHNKIVAFKKLYLLDDPQELHEVATQELRYAGPGSEFVDSSVLTYEADGIEKEKSQVQINLATQALLYTGGDFTAPEYRNKGINTKLTECAFADPDIKKEIGMRLKRSSMIACVYGLTHFNDYADDGSGTSRTIGIARLFGSCIATVMNIHTRIILYHKRFKSFMPTFDFSSEKCVPLPDEQAVPGYGNVLYYQCVNDAQ